MNKYLIILSIIALVFLTGCTKQISCIDNSDCRDDEYCSKVSIFNGYCVTPAVIPAGSMTMAAVQDRCNIKFVTNFTHTISVNHGPFSNYDEGICNGDNILVLYYNNSHCPNKIFQKTVNVNTNVITDDEMVCEKSIEMNLVDELVMKMINDNDYRNIDAEKGISVNFDEDVIIKIQISSLHNTTIPDMTCIIDHSDITKSEPNIKIWDYYRTVEITNEWYRPISYVYKSGNSNIEVSDLINEKKLNTVSFDIYLGVREAQTLANTSLSIECYSKEYYLEKRDDKIHYMFEDFDGNIQSKNILKEEINIYEYKATEEVLCLDKNVKITGDNLIWTNCTINMGK